MENKHLLLLIALKLKRVKVYILAIFSALLFVVSFCIPDLFGWLVVPSITILFVYRERSGIQNFGAGLLWGAIVFGAHFLWVLHILLTRSNATLLLSSMLYLLLVFYCAFTSAIWFLIMSHIRILWRAIVTFAYFCFLAKYLLWFLPSVHRYPFLNPMLPLVRYKWFVFIMSFLCGGVPSGPILKPITWQGEKAYEHILSTGEKTIFLDARIYKEYGSTYSPEEEGDLLLEVLKAKRLYEATKKYNNVFVFAPESTLSFSPIKKKEVAAKWQRELPKNAMLFVCGLRGNEKSGYGHSLFQVSASLIMKAYDKQHAVDLTEKTKRIWKRWGWARNLFLHNKLGYKKAKSKTRKILRAGGMKFEPFICSDFFISNFKERRDIKPDLITVYANDSWFPWWFCNLMERYLLFRAIQTQTPILYISQKLY